MRLFSGILASERRDTFAAFGLLFGLIGSHSVLETARDALFLSKIAPERLPVVYIGIAIVSLAITQWQQRVGKRMGARAGLVLWIGLAAVVTAVFWATLEKMGDVGLYALYVWSGVLTTLVLVHFWTLLGSIFSITQAKRVYGTIGTGSVLGAIVGSGTAGVLASRMQADYLVLVAAGGFALTALTPFLLGDPGRAGGDDEKEGGTSLWEAAAFVAQRPYARKVATAVVVSTATLTVADYIFKSTVANEVDAAELGTFFATVYLVLNALSLVSQLFLVGWLLRRFDIATALSVLPVLLVLGGTGMLLLGGLAAAVAIKGSDGAFKHSLHRTATELMFVPMSDSARAKVKAFIDVAGQRGGQSIASIGILAGAQLTVGFAGFAVALMILAVLWLFNNAALRRDYLALLRGRLHGVMGASEFPELDMASLETLITSLDSTNDRQVIVALEALEREGRARLVPALILYHPSDAVVIRALDLFRRTHRASVLPVTKRLLEHDSPDVRRAAVAMRAAVDPAERWMRMHLSLEDSAEVRATVTVNLIASGAILGSDAKDTLDSLMKHGSSATKIALAEAIAERHAEAFDDTLIELTRDPDSRVANAAAAAIGEVRVPHGVESLVHLLGRDTTRDAAQDALVACGRLGFTTLERALEKPDLPKPVRWELPRALARFEPQRAAESILRHLPNEKNGLARYRSIRVLERLRRQVPDLNLDEAAIRQGIFDSLARAYRYLDRRLILTAGREQQPERDTPGHRLLSNSMRDKQAHTVGRVFRLLGLVYPDEGFDDIWRGLQSDEREKRTSSIELVDNLLRPPLRGAVVALIDDLPDEERLIAGRTYHEPLRLDYEGLLKHMLDSSSTAVQDITCYHVAELRLMHFCEPIEKLIERVGVRPDLERALNILSTSEATHAH